MALKVIISGSRVSKEREIIKKQLEKYAIFDIQIYDCNDTPTDTTREGKQQEINGIIQKYDWYILIASTTKYGKYTYQEWDAITNSILTKPFEQAVTVFKCKNPEESEQEQNISYKDKKEEDLFDFDDFIKLCDKKGIAENFNVEYTYDPSFDSLTVAITNEIEFMLNRHLSLRRDSIPLKAMTAKDIYTNQYRSFRENGFDEEKYLWRDYLDGALDKQNGCSIIVGSSASGKTRALYEYLKREAEGADNNKRLVIVTRHNLANVCHDIELFSKWNEDLNETNRSDLSSYYFVCDQVGDLFYNNEHILQFDHLYQLLTNQFRSRMIVTALEENFDGVMKKQCYIVDAPIRILSLNENYNIHDEVRTFFQLKEDEQINKTVIGEYIKGLVDYNDSIEREVKKYFEQNKNDKIIDQFMKSFSVITLYRKGDVIPLALVLAVLEKIQGEPITKKVLLQDILQFFFEKNIFSLFREDDEDYSNTLSSVESNIVIEPNFVYEYDNEKLKLPIAPDYMIHIENEYIWNKYLLKKYALTIDNKKDMENAMRYFAQAFINENPLPTLRRIISRSPSVILSIKYSAYDDFVGAFVKKQFELLYDNKKLLKSSRAELCEFLSYFIHRAKNYEDFVSRFNFAETELVKGFYDQSNELPEEVKTQKGFLFDENNIGELMGFGTQRSYMVKSKIISFLEEHGWNFHEYRGTSIYYHKRIVQYLNNFNEVKQYVSKNIESLKNNKELFPREEFSQLNREQFILSCLPTCTHCEDILTLLDWVREINLFIRGKLLRSIHTFIKGKKNLDNPEANKMIVSKIKTVFENEDQTQSMRPEMRYYYLLFMSNTFINGVEYFHQGLAFWKNNPKLRNIAISKLIEVTQEYEFSHVYREFFKDRKLIEYLPQISRNLLLKQLNVDDALNLTDLLFDGTDVDSIPDTNTIISLLLDNLKFMKNHLNFNHINNSSNLYNLSYQNLILILTHPKLKDISYNESAISLILLSCHTENQEQHIISQYLTPNIRKLFKKKFGKEYSDNTLDAKVSDYFDKIKNSQKYTVPHLNTINNLESLIAYGKKSIENLITSSVVRNEKGKEISQVILDPSIISNLFNRIFHLFRISYKTRKPIDQNLFKDVCQDLYNFLFLEKRFNMNARNPKAAIDYFYKDEHFYTAFYRLYPNEAVEFTDDTYVWKEEFKNLPTTFLNNKLFANLLTGLATFMGENAVDKIEKWIYKNIPNYSTPINVVYTIKTILPEHEFCTFESLQEEVTSTTFKQNTGWGFLETFYRDWVHEDRDIKERAKHIKYTTGNKVYIPRNVIFTEDLMASVYKVKEEFPNSTPNIKMVHDILKSAVLSAEQALEFIEIVYLKQGLVLTASLWKSVLESLKQNGKSFPKGSFSELLTSFKANYPNLIFENTTTLIYQLTLLSGEERVKCFNKIKNEHTFMTQLELSELIQNTDLFKDDIIEYVSLMIQYVEQNEVLYSAQNITPTFNHFIVNLLSLYDDNKDLLSVNYKKFIIDIMLDIDDYEDHENRIWLSNKLLARETAFYSMLHDLRLATGEETDFLEELLWNKN